MGRIRQIAHATAQAEYGPQKRRVQRETGAQVRSLRSEEPALVAAIELARKQLRHSGLSGRDLAIAESELAHRTMDVGASTALQVSEAHREAAQKLIDLAEGQGQAERGTMATLQKEAADRRYELGKEKANDVRDFQLAIQKAMVLHALGLSSSGSSTGLTPTQMREHNQSRHAAAHYAQEYVHAARNGLVDEKTGKRVLPPGPHNWNDQQWGIFVDKVASKLGGATHLTDAEHAVQAVRAHFQPGGSLMGALRTVAAATAPGVAALAPQGVQPILQAGMPLLRHR